MTMRTTTTTTALAFRIHNVCMHCVLYLFMTRGLKIISKAWYELNWIELNVHSTYNFIVEVCYHYIIFISFHSGWSKFFPRCVRVCVSVCVSALYVFVCVWHASIHYIFYIHFMSTMHTHTHTLCELLRKLHCLRFVHSRLLPIPFSRCTHVSPSSFV